MPPLQVASWKFENSSNHFLISLKHNLFEQKSFLMSKISSAQKTTFTQSFILEPIHWKWKAHTQQKFLHLWVKWLDGNWILINLGALHSDSHQMSTCFAKSHQLMRITYFPSRQTMFCCIHAQIPVLSKAYYGQLSCFVREQSQTFPYMHMCDCMPKNTENSKSNNPESKRSFQYPRVKFLINVPVL